MPRFSYATGLSVLLALTLLAKPRTLATEGELQRSFDLAVTNSQTGPRPTVYGAAAGDAFGRIIRTGNLNGDSYLDLIVATDKKTIHVWLGRDSYPALLDASKTDSTGPSFSISGYDKLRSLEIADITGDGRDDLIVGFAPTKDGSGNVAIVPGRHAFPTTVSIETTVGQQAGSLCLISAGDLNDGLGEGGLAFADFNQDGVKDVILGAPLADGPADTRQDCGEVYVIFGRTSFPPALTMVPSNPQGPDILLFGRNGGDRLTQGGALHVADLNGDGKPDLVLGAPAAAGRSSSAGEAYLFAGKESYQPGYVLDLQDESITVINGPQANAALTAGGIASGDINGDGIQDLLLSAPTGRSPASPSIPAAGVVFGILGRATWPQFIRLDIPPGSPGVPYGLANFLIQGWSANDQLTADRVLTTADVNGDGLADIICGSSTADNTANGGTEAGQVYILYGRRAPAVFPPFLQLQAQQQTTAADVTLHGAYTGDHLGKGGAIAAGDVDGDGITDLLVGAPDAAGQTSGGRPGAGRVYIVAGRHGFPKNIKLREEGNPYEGPTSVLRGASDADALSAGGSLALADLTGDGDLDLLVGASAADGPGEARTGCGEVYVVPGKHRGNLAAYAPDGSLVYQDRVVDLGNVGQGEEIPIPFTLTNIGRGTLFLNGFQCISSLDLSCHILPLTGDLSLEDGESRTADVFLRPSTLGDKEATLVLQSSPHSAAPTTTKFYLKFKVVKAEPPTVKTGPGIAGVVTAEFKGQVTTKGKARRLFFDYGRTQDFTAFVESLPSAAADAAPNTNFSASAGNLLPHTRYYYRARATSQEGAAVGATLSFTTGNTTPVSVNDTFAVTNASTVSLPVTLNDADADGDLLKVATFTQPKAGAKTVGKLTKVGDALFFTAPANFDILAATEVSFTYTARDGFGGTTQPAKVVLTAGSAELNLAEIEVPAAGGEHSVYVTTEAHWSAQDSVPWIHTSAVDSFAVIQVLPNFAKAERRATVTIGGLPHLVIQAGVLKPSISLPEKGIPAAAVSSPFELQIVTQNAPVTYTVAKLPPGLAINQATGLISGSPTRGGTYPVTVRAANAAGTADAVLSFDLQVAELNPGIVGTFLGFIASSDLSPGGMGSRLEMTVANTGAVTGKVITPALAYAFTTRLVASTEPDGPAVMSLDIIPADKQPRTLALTLDPASATAYGTFTSNGMGYQVHVWRNVWTAANPPPAVIRGLHTFFLQGQDAGAPGGNGFGSYTVQAKTGNITVTGKLPDGNAFATVGFLGPQGEILIYQPLYAKKGLFAGMLDLEMEDGPEQGQVTAKFDLPPKWYDPGSPTGAADNLYPLGFGPASVSVSGGLFPTPVPGALILGAEVATGETNAIFTLTDLALSQNLNLRNITPNGFTHKVTPVGASDLIKFTMPVLNATNGLLSGEFTLTGATPSQNLRITYQGMLVRVGGVVQGYGCFLQPELPDAPGETPANTPRWSRPFTVSPAPAN